MEKIEVIETGSKNGLYICPNCGATEIEYNKKLGKLYCKYCDSTFEGQKIDKIEENLFNLTGHKIGSGARDIKENFDNIITLRCNGCGAEVTIDTSEKTEARCHWCRGILSINERIENGVIPDVILPFKVTKEEAQEEIKKFVEKRQFFAKSKFKKEFKLDNIMGVYFPYMIIDAKAHCNFEGEGEHLTRIRKRNKTTLYDANAYKVKREFDIMVDDLTTETKKEILKKFSENRTNYILNSIMPFDTKNCIKFRSNYLKGYTSEKRNINIPELKEKVQKQINDITRYTLNDYMTYYDRGINWKKQQINIEGTRWLTAYLPVWVYSYHEVKKGKTINHYVAVNGRTKETNGSIPVDKVVLITMTIVLVIAMLLILPISPEAKIIFSIEIGRIFYKTKLNKYRNQKSRHQYETETKSIITNMKEEDIFMCERNCTHDKYIKGKNNTNIEGDIVDKSNNSTN